MKKWQNFYSAGRRLRNTAWLMALVWGTGLTQADTLQIIPAGTQADTASARTAIVKADRLNVRARPGTAAEVVAQLQRGDVVEILERKAGEKTTEWLRIPLPATAKCYVSAKYVSGGVVTADRVNVRCGPGLNHQDVGKLNKGDIVTVLKEQADWLQIKPTPQCSGWISAEFVELVPMVEPAPVPAPVVSPAVAAPAQPPLAVAEVSERFSVRTGILRWLGDAANAPGEYELLTPEKDGKQHRIAYVHAPQLKLRRYDGKEVRVLGMERWKRDERYPVLLPERVDPVL